MKRYIKFLPLALMFSSLVLTSCQTVPHIGDNGNFWYETTDLNVTATGPKGEKGEQGDQGNPGVTIENIEKTSSTENVDIYTITYSDGTTTTFTVVNGINGEQGIQGILGEDGITQTISVGDNGNWFIDGVDSGIHAQGIKGDKGDKGEIGNKGPKGDKGEDGYNGISVLSVTLTNSKDNVDTYIISYSDGTTSSFTVTNGKDGNQGIQGYPGEDGHTPTIYISTSTGNWVIDNVDSGIKATGLKGETGDKGAAGEAGDKGPKGETGDKGQDGKSVYEIYLETHPGYVGDEQQWLDDLANNRLTNQVFHTVKFVDYDESLINETKVLHGEKIAKPQNPKRYGYVFTSWTYKNETWSFIGCPVTEDMVLQANYSSAYEVMSINDARNKNPDSLVKVTGVVSTITYNSAGTPTGFMLVDETGSIFVNDLDVVSKVTKGKEITISGKRENHISARESFSASKFGYQGSIALTECFINNIGKEKEFSTNWIEEKTVKEILDTPLSKNITTNLYCVRAYVVKDEENGIINYFIKDLDNATTTYLDPNNIGLDFSYLNQFNNKLCDLILSPINVRCNNVGYNYQFLLLKCSLSNYKLPEEDFAKYAAEYHVKDQFLDEYIYDPSLELKTAIYDPWFGNDFVNVSYKTSNANVISLENINGKIIMHTNNPGNATITCTATYKTYEFVIKKSIFVLNFDTSNMIGIKEAINKEDNIMVNVKGIVIGSAVNQPAIYIADETGVIAVRSTIEQIENLKIGNTVYFRGIKKHFKKSNEKPDLGQIVIDEAELLARDFVENPIPTNSFVTNKTFAEVASYDSCKDDVSAQLFIVTAKISVEETPYYSTISLVDPNDDSIRIRLYCSSARQYDFLKQFNNRIASLELALCNWNNKTYYMGCVISATSGNVKVNNNYNFK